jgi:hypothetical protein
MDQWVGGIVTGVLLACITQWVNSWFQHRKYIREKRIEKYGELLGLAAADVHRAKAVEATFAVGPTFDDETFKQFFARLEDERHALSRDLTKIVYQLRLLEPNLTIVEAIDALRKDQPFLVPGRFGQGNFDERFDKYKKDIQEYESCIKLIADLTQKIYCRE